MGMMLGSISTSRKIIQIKRPDGSVAASFSVSRPKQKKHKRLNYNFKAVSSQIMLSKTSNNAGKAVTKARGMIAALLRKTFSDDYDDQELEHAIIHARKMERIAKKRVKHLKQEEEIEKKGSSKETEDMMEEAEEKQETQEIEFSEEELQQMMDEYQKMIQESMQELMEQLMQESMEEMQVEMDLDELSEDLGEAVSDMNSEDLERLKKKHRSDEMREIMDADMKYLRAFFNKLEKERQALANGSSNFSGVSLELSGVEMPVAMPEMPVMAEGGNVDLML